MAGCATLIRIYDISLLMNKQFLVRVDEVDRPWEIRLLDCGKLTAASVGRRLYKFEDIRIV